ncbi:hypothetical protein [Pukyongiella litopenaei]|uniref:Uncharacterized protein n=1 Tax=Pukyongiella litopenaei TaxID=2605946 RepID=A0A2S0MNL8_9RHOB|nr:hypothetical protein [Pukyongiella litopenaei]AVO37474.1 hypothetical protein C6Y53_06930 [Pukyongiella litopenaei]
MFLHRVRTGARTATPVPILLSLFLSFFGFAPVLMRFVTAPLRYYRLTRDPGARQAMVNLFAWSLLIQYVVGTSFYNPSGAVDETGRQGVFAVLETAQNPVFAEVLVLFWLVLLLLPAWPTVHYWSRRTEGSTEPAQYWALMIGFGALGNLLNTAYYASSQHLLPLLATNPQTSQTSQFWGMAHTHLFDALWAGLAVVAAINLYRIDRRLTWKPFLTGLAMLAVLGTLFENAVTLGLSLLWPDSLLLWII